MAVALENSRLFEEAAKSIRLQNDLETAREIQRQLLPTGAREIPGLDLATAYVPARELGGDFYDFLPYGSAAWPLPRAMSPARAPPPLSMARWPSAFFAKLSTSARALPPKCSTSQLAAFSQPAWMHVSSPCSSPSTTPPSGNSASPTPADSSPASPQRRGYRNQRDRRASRLASRGGVR